MVDATKVSKIKINEGRADEREHQIFTRVNSKGVTLEDAQVSIVLGGNGSGKSTLARALSTETDRTEFLDKGDGLLDKDFSNIHVFDENFILENFRKSDNEILESFILLGEDSVAMGHEIENLEIIKKYWLKKKKEYNEKIDIKKKEMGHVIEKLQSLLESEIDALKNKSDIDDVYIEQMKIGVEGFMENIKIIVESPGGKPCTVASIVAKEKLSDEIFGKWVSAKFNEAGAHNIFMDFPMNCSNESLKPYGDSLKQAREEIEENHLYVRNSNDPASKKRYISEMEKSGFKYAESLRYIISILSPKMHQEIKDINIGYLSRIINSEEGMSVASKEIDKIELQISDELKSIDLKNRDKSRDEINNLLNIVFCGADVTLESAAEFGYRLKNSRGYVAPSKLSMGEQNILSLCYFFAKMADGKSIQDSLSGNQIIVLDDPISSFDEEKKYGVTMLLAYLCQFILKDNSNTKLIILTHDASFALDMSKMIKSINSNKLLCCELNDGTVEPLAATEFVDEYHRILKLMYGYIVEKNEGDKPNPNDVRRVWEAFLCFEFGETAISNFSILNRIKKCFSVNNKVEKFIDCFIPQLFINVDSHAADQVKNGNFYLEPIVKGDSYRKFVEQLLCFMHIIAPYHIAWRLRGQDEEVEVRKNKLDETLSRVLNP